MKITISELVSGVLLETLKMQGLDVPVELNVGTQLIGKNGILDSLSFVAFIIAVEQKINSEYAANISINNEKAFSQSKSPFGSIGSLAEYIASLLKEQNK